MTPRSKGSRAGQFVLAARSSSTNNLLALKPTRTVVLLDELLLQLKGEEHNEPTPLSACLRREAGIDPSEVRRCRLPNNKMARMGGTGAPLTTIDKLHMYTTLVGRTSNDFIEVTDSNGVIVLQREFRTSSKETSHVDKHIGEDKDEEEVKDVDEEEEHEDEADEADEEDEEDERFRLPILNWDAPPRISPFLPTQYIEEYLQDLQTRKHNLHHNLVKQKHNSSKRGINWYLHGH